MDKIICSVQTMGLKNGKTCILKGCLNPAEISDLLKREFNLEIAEISEVRYYEMDSADAERVHLIINGFDYEYTGTIGSWRYEKMKRVFIMAVAG